MSVTSPSWALASRPNTKTWTIPPGVTDHGGNPLPPDTEFFAPPPPEIGVIRSAYSSLKTTTHRKSMATRLGIALAFGGGIGGAVTITLAILLRDFNTDVAYITGAIILAVLAPLTMLTMLFRHVCTYVGEKGIARFTLKGDRGRPTKNEVLLFVDAAELRTRVVRQYVNGVHTSTNFDFTWTSPQGTKLFSLAGSDWGEGKRPKPIAQGLFARAAEIAWSVHELDRLPDTLQKYGFLHFNLAGPDYVRVGPGFFEFCLRGSTSRVTVEEIKSLNLNQGMFDIAHKDSGWFGRGHFRFEYGKLANAKLFLFAIEKLLGYSFQ